MPQGSSTSCFEFVETDDSVTVVGWSGECNSPLIPSSFLEKRVRILLSVFAENDNIRSISVPESITEIAEGCFLNCHSLSEITFARRILLREFSRNMFAHTSLRTIKVPKMVEVINAECFNSCQNLTEIEFDEAARIKRFGERAFAGSGLQAINVPITVEAIDDGCFEECSSLRHVSFQEGSHLQLIGSRVFFKTAVEDITIPRTVRQLGEGCFEECAALARATFSTGINLKTLNKRTFYRSGLETVIIPKSTEVVDEECFRECGSLSSVKFVRGAHLKKFGEACFAHTALTKFTVVQSVEQIGTACFGECTALREVFFQDESRLKKLGKFAFMNTGLVKFVVPKGVTEIEDACFGRCCSLSRIEFEAGTQINVLHKQAFFGSGLMTVMIPNTIEKIGYGCFGDCSSLDIVEFEPGSIIKKLKRSVFAGTRIRTFKVPKMVKEIGKTCFWKCQYLTDITFEGRDIRKVEDGAFTNTNVRSVHVPLGFRDKFLDILSRNESGLNLESVVENDVDLSANTRDLIIDISEYTLGAKVGAHGSGSIILSKDDFSVVAKFIPDYDPTSDPNLLVAFEREIRKLRSMPHPFMRLHGFSLPSGDTDECFVLVMESSIGSLRGWQSLASAIKHHPAWFNEAEKIRILYQIALGMSKAHSDGITDCGLNSRYVLLDQNHVPHICYFGSKRVFSGVKPGSPSGSRKREDKKDVYHFGVILYEMATNQLASRDTDMSIVPGSVPPSMRNLIGSCLDINEQKRPSFDSIQRHLRINGGQGNAREPSSARLPSARRAHRSPRV